jgi:hypothetical protein
MNIKFTKQVVFKDWNGKVLKVYEIGQIINATCDAGHYWVTNMGGIYKDEATLNGLNACHSETISV